MIFIRVLISYLCENVIEVYLIKFINITKGITINILLYILLFYYFYLGEFFFNYLKIQIFVQVLILKDLFSRIISKLNLFLLINNDNSFWKLI